MELRINKLEKDVDRLWHKLDIVNIKQNSFEETLNSIKTTLLELNSNEIKKAVDRQKMNDTLELLLSSQKENRESLNLHSMEELKEMKQFKKWLVGLTILVVAIIIDSQANTNIVNSILGYFVHSVLGV